MKDNIILSSFFIFEVFWLAFVLVQIWLEIYRLTSYFFLNLQFMDEPWCPFNAEKYWRASGDV